MREKLWSALRGGAVLVAVFALLSGGYYLGFAQGKKQSDTVVVEGVANTGSPIAPADFGIFWQAWQLISENYLNNEDIANREKVYGAIRGFVGSLNDPYSEYFNPEENKQFQEDVQGNFSGIGAEIGLRQNQLQIIAPLKGSPAERAGLKAGDKIFAINASSTEGITVDRAVRQIRGREGTVVTLAVFREGWDRPRDFEIRRETIVVPTLEFEMKGDIAYVALASFNANASDLFADAAIDAVKNGARGMVLDLRNNPGGYLDVAVRLAGWFLPRGTVVVSEESRIEPRVDLKASGNGALRDMPVAVLINQGSASASEILAGSLRDHGKATLVGEQSYGKGTVQQILPLKDDSSIKATVAHWVLPNGQVLEGAGLKPDVEVKNTDEDTEAGRDPQLDKALEVVRSK